MAKATANTAKATANTAKAERKTAAVETKENEKNILRKMDQVNHGLRVDVNRALAIIGAVTMKNKKLTDEDLKNTVTVSFSQLNTSDVQTLQKRYYNIYRNYRKSGFRTLAYIKTLKADADNVYDLTKIINKNFVDFTTECLRNMNIIDKDSNILDHKAFDKVSERLVIKLDTPRLSTVKTSRDFVIYNEGSIRSGKNPFHARVLEQDNGEIKVIRDKNKFVPFTTNTILPIAEKVMGCKFKEDPFTLDM